MDIFQIKLITVNFDVGIRVFHKIGFSAFQGSETDEIQNASPIFDVESESEEKMGTFFSGKKLALTWLLRFANFVIFRVFFKSL